MAKNIEIKARVGDLENLKQLAEQVSDSAPELLIQEDTFFRVEKGRLKLRVLGPDRAELIYYERADSLAPRPSDYRIFRTSDPECLKTLLSIGLGVRGVVRKRRWLYLAGTTRIHLDQVENLGTFVEIEVVLGAGQTMAEGTAIARRLMERLGIREADLVEKAYIDLLEEQGPEEAGFR
jgi:adenylate cyclase class IV